jgi:hypothetical protein
MVNYRQKNFTNPANLIHHPDRRKKRIFLAVLIAVFLTTVSTWAAPKPKPTSSASRDETISGLVENVDRGDNSEADNGAPVGIELRTLNGDLYEVTPDSTLLIHPTGTRISMGMKIKVFGHVEGQIFLAYVITVLSYH